MTLIRLSAMLLACMAALPAAPTHADDLPRAALSTRTTLNLASAQAIAAVAEAEAQRMQLRVSIAIVDDAGRLLLFRRIDGSGNSTVDVAIGKAVHAVNFRRDTAFHQQLLEKNALPVLALPEALPIEGGVMLKHGEEVIGAIGISGGQSAQDGIIARAGAAVLTGAKVVGSR